MIDRSYLPFQSARDYQDPGYAEVDGILPFRTHQFAQ